MLHRIYCWADDNNRSDVNSVSVSECVLQCLAAAFSRMTNVELISVCWHSDAQALVRAGTARLRHGKPDNDFVQTKRGELDLPLHLSDHDAALLNGSCLIFAGMRDLGQESGARHRMAPALDYAHRHGLFSVALFDNVMVPHLTETIAEADPAYRLALTEVDLILPISQAACADLMNRWYARGIDANRLPPRGTIPFDAEMVKACYVSSCESHSPDNAMQEVARPPVRQADREEKEEDRFTAQWSDFAEAILVAIDAAPRVPLILVIEGLRGGGEVLASTLEAASTRVWRHYWRADSQAILPGFRQNRDTGSEIGRGDLRGLWALLPLSTTNGVAETVQVLNEAHGLGLKVAVVAESGRSICDADVPLFDSADLVFFATKAERDSALERSPQATVEPATRAHRYRIAPDARGMLALIASERTHSSSVEAPRRIFYWTGVTASQTFNTGIQRVTRALGRAMIELGVDVVPVKWDLTAASIVPLDAVEAANLARWNGPQVHAPETLPDNLAGEWLFIPEPIVPGPPGLYIAQFAHSRGMRVAAIFYDLMPSKLASIYPPEWLGLPASMRYWGLFSEVDVALPISWTVAADLVQYLREQKLSVPPIVVCQLAGDLPGVARQHAVRESNRVPGQLKLIAIGTWEPRKNYPRLLRALIDARRLATDITIHLTIVGRRGAAFANLNLEINQLAEQAGNVDLYDYISDAELLSLINDSDATLFGSWEEGFGLPVLESLWCGLPCLCHDGSAMAEVAPGGGTLALDMLDEKAIAKGIFRLATEHGLIDRLRREALARPIRKWSEYGRDVLSSMARTVIMSGSSPNGSTDGQIAAHDALIGRFAEATEPALRERVAWALLDKGLTLSQLNRSEEAIGAYDELIVRFASARELALRECVAVVLLNKGAALLKLNRPEKAIAVYDELLARSADANEPALHERFAAALSDKGVTLSQLNRWDEAIAAYDALILRFADAIEPALRERVAGALLNKALALVQLNRSEGALEAYDVLMARFADASEPALRERVDAALLNKGALLDKLNRSAEAIAVYDALIARSADFNEPAVRERVALALANKGVLLSKLNRLDEAIEVCDDLIARLTDANEPALRERVAWALLDKGFTLGQLNRSKEAIGAYDAVIMRFADASELTLRERVAVALLNKGVALLQLNRAEDAIEVHDALLARLADASEPALRELFARALSDKGITLNLLNRWDDAIASYDALILRFADAIEPALRERVSVALLNKALALVQLNRSGEALEAYDMLIARFADAREAALRGEAVATALVNKGASLSQLNHWQESIEAYDALIGRFADASEPALRERVDAALLNKGVALGQLNRSTEAIAAYDALIARSADVCESVLGERVAVALFNKGVTLGQLNRAEGAIAAYEALVERFAAATEPALRELMTMALIDMAAYLIVLARYGDARARAREGLALARELQVSVLAAWALQHLAAVAALRSRGKAERALTEHIQAARILGFVNARLTLFGASREDTEQREYDWVLAELRDVNGSDELAKLMAAGAELTEDQAIEGALLI